MTKGGRAKTLPPRLFNKVEKMLMNKPGSEHPGTMADIEPSIYIRQDIENDLRIKGQVSAPQKFDMSKVIPVYDLRQSIQGFFQDQWSGDQDGNAEYYTDIIKCPALKCRYFRLNSFYFNFYMDAAARAIAANHNAFLEIGFNSRPNMGSIEYPIGGGILRITPLAATNLFIVAADRLHSHHDPVMILTSFVIPMMIWNDIFHTIVPGDKYLTIRFTIQGINFPASSGVAWYVTGEKF